jgi:proline dehydrogenase
MILFLLPRRLLDFDVNFQAVMDSKALDFNDTETAFRDKTDGELKQRHRLFKTLNSQTLVDAGAFAAGIALRFRLPVRGLIKATVFKYFCGGENLEECEPTVRKLGASGIGTILDYAIEGKEKEHELDATCAELLRNIDRAKENIDIPFAVFKVTGIARFGLLEKVSSREVLTPEESEEFERVRRRVEKICRKGAEVGQPVFIDAEESWIQDAIDSLAEEMMERYNREKVIVFHTVQLYRRDRLGYLRDSFRRINLKGSKYGVKLVRGAYLEKERGRALEFKYESPVHERLEDTSGDFDSAVDFCIANLEGMSFVAATHNEVATAHVVEKMIESGIRTDDPRVNFSQLFGMSDNISYVLANAGFNVSKYLPYGPVEDAIPYLTRRARENSSVRGQASRELRMIERELERRKLVG